MKLRPYAREHLGADTSGRPLVLDRATKAAFDIAVRRSRLDGKVVIVQGSYRAGDGAAASAGTHDRGGVLDIRTWNLTDDERRRLLWQLRRVGFAAWYRTTAQGFDPHIHAVLIDHPRLHPAAAAQVVAYRAGYNGLASHGRDDFRRPDPIPVFDFRHHVENTRITALIGRVRRLRNNIRGRRVTKRRLTRAIRVLQKARTMQ